jgi:hypothetical protein
MTQEEAYQAVVVALKRYRNNPTPGAVETLIRAAEALRAFVRNG